MVPVARAAVLKVFRRTAFLHHLAIQRAEGQPQSGRCLEPQAGISNRAGAADVHAPPASHHSSSSSSSSSSGIPGVKHIVAVASGKGGVGKSTTAVNLAVSLARHSSLCVSLLDADVYGPSIPRLMGLKGQPMLDRASGKMLPLSSYGVNCMSMGFLLPDAKDDVESAAAIWRGPMVMSALEHMIRNTAWGRGGGGRGGVDVMVVDMPPGTGDAHLSITQRLRLSGALIVSTPQDLALADARRAVAMFRKVNVPILGLVENMSFFSCPSCGSSSYIFGHGGARREAEQLGVDFLAEIPLKTSIRERSDAGRPSSCGTASPSSSSPLPSPTFSKDLRAHEGHGQGEEERIYKELACKVLEKLKEAEEKSGSTRAPTIVTE